MGEKEKFDEDLLREDRGPVVPEHDDSGMDSSRQENDRKDLHVLTSVLVKYKALLFEPDKAELEPDDMDRQVDEFMERSAHIRPKEEIKESDKKGKIISLFSGRTNVLKPLAVAAVFLLVFTVAVFKYHTAKHPVVEIEPKKFAYLTDVQGTVDIFRHKEDIKLTADAAGSIHLYTGDEISIASKSGAIITSADDVFFLTDEGQYRIFSDRLLRVDKEPYSEIRPVLSARIDADPDHFIDVQQIAMAPMDLHREVEPPIYRDVELEAYVLSPSGIILSDMPRFKWADRETLEDNEEPVYEVTIRSVDRDEIVGTVRTNDQEFKWGETGFEPFQRGGEYMLFIRRNGRIITRDDGVLFRVMGEQKAEMLSGILATISEAIPDGEARRFITANLLVSPNWQCYSEALYEAQKLVEKSPESLTYLKLLQRCYNKLNMPAAVRAIQQHIDEL